MDAALAGEPEDALLVEGRGIEIGVGEFLRQREQLDLRGDRIDAGDGVLAALGDPRRAVRPDDDAVGRGAGPERDVLVLAGLGIEMAEKALLLAAVPHRAVGRRGDVMRIGAGRQLIERHLARRMRNEAATHARRGRERNGLSTFHRSISSIKSSSLQLTGTGDSAAQCELRGRRARTLRRAFLGVEPEKARIRDSSSPATGRSRPTSHSRPASPVK